MYKIQSRGGPLVERGSCLAFRTKRVGRMFHFISVFGDLSLSLILRHYPLGSWKTNSHYIQHEQRRGVKEDVKNHCKGVRRWLIDDPRRVAESMCFVFSCSVNSHDGARKWKRSQWATSVSLYRRRGLIDWSESGNWTTGKVLDICINV